MDAPNAVKAVKINRLLPYWAVFQADLRQTLTSWIYRVWVLVSLGAAVGYLLYRFGAKQVGGFVQPAPEMMSDLMNWVAFGSVTLVIVLTAGAICSERGTMADSVLSRGISRYQYFLGKWHARLTVVLGTFFVIALLALIGSFFMLHSDSLSLIGSAIALLTVAAILFMVITCGVSVSALSNNTVVSIAIVWMALYSAGFALLAFARDISVARPGVACLTASPQGLLRLADGEQAHQRLAFTIALGGTGGDVWVFKAGCVK